MIEELAACLRAVIISSMCQGGPSNTAMKIRILRHGFHIKTAACSGCSSPVHLPLYCFLAYYINQNPCGAEAPHSSTTITSDPFSTLSLSQMWGQEFSITP